MMQWEHYPLAAQGFGDLLEIIIVVIVVVVAPLAQWLIKFFTPKSPESEGHAPADGAARPARPQHRQRPVAQPMPPQRMPARPVARPLPSGQGGPAMEPVRPLAVPAQPVARPTDKNDDEVSHLPEVLLEMLGVPADEMRRRVMQERQAQQQRRQQRKQAERETKTADARPRMAAPPPARRSVVATRPPERKSTIHTDLPSEQRTARTVAKKRSDDAAGGSGTAAPAVRGLSRLVRGDRSELRRAILLSEVLSPPISLRPPRDFPT